MPRHFQLGHRAAVIAQAAIEIIGACKMRFGSIRPQPGRGLHRSFSQGKPGRSVIKHEYCIKGFVGSGELAVSVEK